jgi:hypothetical protein
MTQHRDETASAAGTPNKAVSEVRASLRLARGPTNASAEGARSEPKASEAVVAAGSARRRTHN